jgi:hypothetical protein
MYQICSVTYNNNNNNNNNNNFSNSIHLFTCLTTAKKGQLQPSTKTTVQDNILKSAQDLKIKN